MTVIYTEQPTTVEGPAPAWAHAARRGVAPTRRVGLIVAIMALVGWMTVRARRDLRSGRAACFSTRRSPVALAAAGGAYETYQGLGTHAPSTTTDS